MIVEGRRARRDRRMLWASLATTGAHKITGTAERQMCRWDDRSQPKSVSSSPI
jgi:hypothetical protein